ncbi:hypothetical protein M5K25_000577 [Dendrobium thyrsiflorum]|uniref:Uncharacterized protein n=1 Tax=Dendrobium thyrsiflorum TaxID=117978 RepID=A0ABD0VTY4_DENTH
MMTKGTRSLRSLLSTYKTLLLFTSPRGVVAQPSTHTELCRAAAAVADSLTPPPLLQPIQPEIRQSRHHPSPLAASAVQLGGRFDRRAKPRCRRRRRRCYDPVRQRLGRATFPGKASWSCLCCSLVRTALCSPLGQLPCLPRRAGRRKGASPLRNLGIHSDLQYDKVELIHRFSGKTITGLAWSSTMDESGDLRLWEWLKKVNLHPRKPGHLRTEFPNLKTHQVKEKEHDSLIVEHLALDRNHMSLLFEFDPLNKKHVDLTNAYESLKSKHFELEESYK